MRLACLFSGGKDSTYAVHLAKWSGHEITCLVSMKPLNADSYLFHTPNIDATALQAEAMGIPLVKVFTPGEKGKELSDLKRALKELKDQAKIEGVVTGAIRSIYQAANIQHICDEVGLFCFNPLWQVRERAHWHELLLQGFDIILVRVASGDLNEGWLGRKMDELSLRQMENISKKEGGHHHSTVGEGGEFESFVRDASLFQKRVVIDHYTDEWKGLQGTRHILRAHLVDKKKESGKNGR